MVTKPSSLRELIASDIVKSISAEVCKRTNSTIFPVYNDTLFEATLNQHEKSGIPIEELYELLNQNRDQFLKYACASVLDSVGATNEQEYPASENPDEADESVVRKELGLSKDFIIPHLIDYWFLVKNPSELEGYLKNTRTPYAKKQAKRLREILKRTVTS